MGLHEQHEERGGAHAWPFESSSTMMRLLDSCSWMRHTFSVPCKPPPARPRAPLSVPPPCACQAAQACRCGPPHSSSARGRVAGAHPDHEVAPRVQRTLPCIASHPRG